jgi:hypothetical protein
MSFANPQLKKLIYLFDLGPSSTRKAMERKIKAHLDSLPDENQMSSELASSHKKQPSLSPSLQRSATESSSSPRNPGHPVITVITSHEISIPEDPPNSLRPFIIIRLPKLQNETNSENRQSQRIDSREQIEYTSSKGTKTEKDVEPSNSDGIPPEDQQPTISSHPSNSASITPSIPSSSSRPSTSYSYMTTTTAPKSPLSSPESTTSTKIIESILYTSPNPSGRVAMLESGGFPGEETYTTEDDLLLTARKDGQRQMKRKGKHLTIGMMLTSKTSFPTWSRNDENDSTEQLRSMSNIQSTPSYTSSKTIRYKDRHNVPDSSLLSVSSPPHRSEQSEISSDSEWIPDWPYWENNLDSKGKWKKVLYMKPYKFSDDEEENDVISESSWDLDEFMEPRIVGDEFDDIPDLTEEQFQNLKTRWASIPIYN